MSITGTILHKKVRELLPGLSSGITPEVLNKTCDDPVSQPFINWFCSNVGRDNCLSSEDIRLAKHIKNQGEWLEDGELDLALSEATKDCPTLTRLFGANADICEQLSTELEDEKEAFKKDEEYLRTLEDSLKKLKELSLMLDDDLEKEETLLEKDRIKVNRLYCDCVCLLEEFDSTHRQFFLDIESLLDTYADAATKKCTPVLWTQVPLENFVKQMEMHNEYLGIYIKRHFGDKIEREDDSEDGTERCGDDKISELLDCQTNIIESKLNEINAKAMNATGVAMAAHAFDIYENNRTSIPECESQIRMEIGALTNQRDILEENIQFLRDNHLKEAAKRYARFVITKILIDDGHARAERRRKSLKKLEHLRILARERGHSHSDFLCMLMRIQHQRLEEIVDFIVDARHYLAAEYNLSSVRTESMREQQTKFDAVIKSTPREQNVFNRILISLFLGPNADPDDVSVATRRYDQLVEENEKRKKYLLGEIHDTRIVKLNKLQDEIMSIYEAETRGPTNSLKPMPYELLAHLDESMRSVRDIQDSVTEMRTKIKDMSKKSDNVFERDRTIMWQRFLADHEALQSKYDEAKRKIENSHFAVTADM